MFYKSALSQCSHKRRWLVVTQASTTCLIVLTWPHMRRETSNSRSPTMPCWDIVCPLQRRFPAIQRGNRSAMNQPYLIWIFELDMQPQSSRCADSKQAHYVPYAWDDIQISICGAQILAGNVTYIYTYITYSCVYYYSDCCYKPSRGVLDDRVKILHHNQKYILVSITNCIKSIKCNQNYIGNFHIGFMACNLLYTKVKIEAEFDTFILWIMLSINWYAHGTYTSLSIYTSDSVHSIGIREDKI